MDAYLFPETCEFLCVDCAREAVCEERIDNPEAKSVSEMMEESCYSAGGGESDSPTHCASCGVFLDNPLTDDGADYVASEIADSMRYLPENSRRVFREWAGAYGDYVGMAENIGKRILEHLME